MSILDAEDDLNSSLVSITYSRLLAREIGVHKDNADQFLKGTPLSFEQLCSLDGKISFAEQATLVKNAIALSGDPALGLHMGPKLHIATHGPLGMVLISSPNVTAILEAFAKYSSVRAQFAQMSFETTPEYLVVEIHDMPAMGDFHDFFYELMMSILQYVVEEVIGEPLTGGRYCFVHGEPEHVASYPQILHSSIEFDCDRYLFCVPRKLGDTPSPFADQNLFDHAVLLCEQRLSELQKSDNIVKAVQKLLFDNPGHIWTLDNVADALNISSRTVMRKLKVEGTTYKQVLDGVHKEMVVRYLMHKNLSIDRIGYLLGYSDASSFRRGFKRWFGTTPSKYMEQNQ